MKIFNSKVRRKKFREVKGNIYEEAKGMASKHIRITIGGNE